MNLPPTIHASIAESAVKRVTRMYDASLKGIFVELLQNARRGGAAEIHVEVSRPSADADEARTVRISDDGLGIPDPSVLLSFGESRWPESLAEREDAAGFGFASLSRLGCHVASRPREGKPWSVDLQPRHFLGEAPARIQQGLEKAGHLRPHGTQVSFRVRHAGRFQIQRIQDKLEEAALHHPLPVSLHVQDSDRPRRELSRKGFLDGAALLEEWKGVRLGVLAGPLRGARSPGELNFHGCVLPAGLPGASDSQGMSYAVLADVDSAPELELLLPARDRAVEGPFLDGLRKASRLLALKAMARSESPLPAFEDWEEAHAAGIDMPAHPPLLHRWRAGTALDHWQDHRALARVPRDALLIDADMSQPMRQSLALALADHGSEDRAFAPQESLARYPWHAETPCVKNVRALVAVGGREIPLERLRVSDDPASRDSPLPPRPDAIRILLEDAQGRTLLELPADVVLAEEEGSQEIASPIVAKGASIEPSELACMLKDACFQVSDDPDADSWDTQERWFEERAFDLSVRTLLSEEEALLGSIHRAVESEVLGLVPRDRALSVQIVDGKVSVALDRAAEEKIHEPAS